MVSLPKRREGAPHDSPYGHDDSDDDDSDEDDDDNNLVTVERPKYKIPFAKLKKRG